MSASKLPTEFGIFYPTGWVVIAFPEIGSADRVRSDLLIGGYDDEECRLIRGDEVIPSAEGQLHHANWFGTLGKADEALQLHVAAAKGGSAFLVVYAPTEDEAERVMKVVRRVPFDFAHRYRRFAIQDMK